MKIIFIEIDKANSIESLHVYIKDIFGFPDYYGKNLDALYDCLTSISESVDVIVPSGFGDILDGYGSKMVKVLEDACECNEYLHLQVSATS